MKKVAVHRVGGDHAQAPQLDVVFIHGLRGDARKTWETGFLDSKFWPEWIAQDARLAVWSVDYPTLLTDWTSEKKVPLPQLANSIAFALLQREIGARPLVFVAHSMGGLIAKEIIAQGRFDNRSAQALRTACASVVFYGTPHWGADAVELLADWSADTIDIEKTHLRELRRGSQYLSALSTAFGYWVSQRPSKSELIAFRETQPYLGQMVVPKDSADPRLGASVRVVDLAGENHVSMCKVKGEDDDRVRHLRRLCHELCSSTWQSVGRTRPILLTFHWEDVGAREAAQSVLAALQEAGVPVVTDLAYRETLMAPEGGWVAWRSRALEQAHAMIVFCGAQYLAASYAEAPVDADYCGVVLTVEEACALQPSSLIPVLPDGQTDRRLIPAWAKNFYNGMKLPAHMPQLISALCAIGPAHRDLEDQ